MMQFPTLDLMELRQAELEAEAATRRLAREAGRDGGTTRALVASLVTALRSSDTPTASRLEAYPYRS
jgi:hypothetical protein